MAWAQSVPHGARFDLTLSGVRDVADDPVEDARWAEALDIPSVCRRDHRDRHEGAFRREVASRYGVEPEHVTLTLGASQAITQALFALVRAGDHVIVERPTYEALHRVPDLMGVSVSRLERKLDEGWATVPDRLAQLLTPRTRAVILTNLHNPSGVAMRATELETIAEMAARVGAIVLVDEVYLDFAFDPGAKHPWRPACLVADNAVSWSSTTKCFGFSALRAGWIVTRDPEVAKTMRAASHYFHVDFPLPTAALAARVLREAPALTARADRAIIQGRRVIDRWLAGEGRVAWVPPDAGQTGFIRLPELMDDVAFCAHLRERYETQVVPGSMFEAKGFVRVSFGGAPEELEEALGFFSAALDDLG
jgi:aspartate/methionine/tyrosine aminotransferase